MFLRGSMILILSLIPVLCFGQVAYHGSSIIFDGSTAIAAPYTVSSDHIVTFEAWVSITASSARMNTFNRITSTFPFGGYYLQIDTTGCQFRGSDGQFVPQAFSISSTIKPGLDVWTHLVGVQSATKAYIGGER